MNLNSYIERNRRRVELEFRETGDKRFDLMQRYNNKNIFYKCVNVS